MNDLTKPAQSNPASHRLSALRVRVGDRVLLDGVDVDIPKGKITVIVGVSGAGKSVLLRILAGLLPRDGDVISWQGDVDLHDSHVGVVFQSFALFDELSPTANVQFAIDHRSDRKAQPEQSATEWLDELGVPASAPVAGLSGGQKQRLAIARTLAADPQVVVYDEPTSGLDAASGEKVAKLIRQTQETHGRTSLVVTHDYQTLLPIADEVLFLDAGEKNLVSVPQAEWSAIADRMHAMRRTPASQDDPAGLRPPSLTRRTMAAFDSLFIATGAAFASAARLPMDLLPVFPSVKWAGRFWLHYLRLVGGPSAWLYLIIAGLIAGFTTTYFTFRFLPFRVYTQPLLIDELLSSIGFALYRILVPVLATVLIAARCGAAVAADVGVKRYGGQVDALRTLGVRSQAYLLVPIVAAFLVATPLLEWLAFYAARTISMITFVQTHPDVPSFYWHQHFFRNLRGDDAAVGALWVVTKNLLCGVGTAVIGYHQGLRPKQSAGDVSNAITSTVLWTTLFVLLVHFVIALIEF